jgi:signal transduction histidine kinase
MQGLLTARTDALTPDDRALLEAAAVIGRRFDPGLLALVVERPEIGAALARLEAQDLVFSEDGSSNYVFNHVLQRDSVYQSMLRAHRSDLHLKIARALEKRSEGRLGEVTDLLAYHYRRTDEKSSAFAYLVMAGARSIGVFSLDEAGKFDEFNRRFAFIMHDIKNLVSQLSLVARNAARHADNPAFRADMIATLEGSVGKMNDLLARLAQRTTGSSEAAAAVDIGILLADVVSAKARQHAALTFDHDGSQCFVTGDPIRFEALFGHLIQNAIDAGPAAPIAVTLRHDLATAVVEIADRGVGMSPAFIRNQLFKPFKSTKPGGFGIGAYEAREIARTSGGSLEVTSREGEGTLFTIRLPLALLVASPAGARTSQRIPV